MLGGKSPLEVEVMIAACAHWMGCVWGVTHALQPDYAYTWLEALRDSKSSDEAIERPAWRFYMQAKLLWRTGESCTDRGGGELRVPPPQIVLVEVL